MADSKVDSGIVSDEETKKKEDSFDDAFGNLEKTLQESERISDEDSSDGLRPVKRKCVKNSNEYTERTFIVIDEVNGDNSGTASQNEFGNVSSADDMTERDFLLLDETNCVSGDSDQVLNDTVIDKRKENCDKNDSVNFLGKFDLGNSSAGIRNINERVDLSSNRFATDKLFNTTVSDSPSIIQNDLDKKLLRDNHNNIATSTPYGKGDKCLKNDHIEGSNYVTPARSVLEKYKPLFLQQTQINASQNIDPSIGNISAIECFESPDGRNTSSSVTDQKETQGKEVSEFEEAFVSLYITLFGAVEEESNAKLMNDNAKLKLYHENIVKQNEQDKAKFNEIISEISSKSGLVEGVCNDGANKNDLSVIREESDESGSSLNETVIEKDMNIDLTNAAVGEKNEDAKTKGESVVSTVNDNDNLLENNVTFNDDLDAISLVCSDIDNLTPRTDISDTNKTSCDQEVPLQKNEVDPAIKEEPPDIKIPPSSPDKLSALPDGFLNSDPPTLVATPENNSICSSIVPAEIHVKVEPKSPSPVPSHNPVKVEPNLPPPVSAHNPVKVEPKSPPPVPAENPVKVEPKSPSREEERTSPTKVDDRDGIFISNDPKENEDNNDPGWEYLRRLSNDKERYLLSYCCYFNC